MTYMETMKNRAHVYAEEKNSLAMNTLQEDLTEIAEDFRKRAIDALESGDVKKAEIYVRKAEGLQIAIDRPQFCIDKVKGTVFETCDTCGRVWASIKQFFDKEEKEVDKNLVD